MKVLTLSCFRKICELDTKPNCNERVYQSILRQSLVLLTKFPVNQGGPFYLLFETAVKGNGQFAFDPYSRMVLREIFTRGLEDKEIKNLFYVLAKFPLT